MINPHDIDFKSPARSIDACELKLMASHVREDILAALTEAKSGHTGGSLSCADILVSLYFARMVHDPKNPSWEGRDRLLLSKGHAAPALYAVLANCGYFPKEELKTLRKINSRLQGHPDPRTLPGVEIPGGPEGIGLSEAIGMALAARLDHNEHKIYVIMGDGELNEGEVWEAAMAAVKFKLNNIIVIVDLNGLQQEGKTADIMPTEPVTTKFYAFNWNVQRINGHEIPDILDAINIACQSKEAPNIIFAKTTKGKGVDFMEDNIKFHGTPPTPEQLKEALDRLQHSRGV